MIDIPHLKGLLENANDVTKPTAASNEQLKNALRNNAAELLRLAEIGKQAETSIPKREETDDEYVERLCTFFKAEVSRW